MVELPEADARLLLNALSEGEAVLILGAGASATCTTPAGEKIKQGAALAQLLAEKAGLTFDWEKDDLPGVIGAVVPNRISQEQLNAILRREYTKVVPSPELEDLLGYTWRRLYTWNIDDAVDNVTAGVQRRRYFNGILDKVSVFEGLEFLHVVRLHGDALKPEHGFIFSKEEYSERLNQDSHDWYREAASDYVSYTPIFIGSRLAEPIMEAELDRARPSKGAGLGLAFLVTPDNFTDVQAANLAAKNVVVIKATLSDFVEWLRENTGKKVTPVDVARRINAFAEELAERFSVNATDVDTAQYIVIHTWKDTKIAADALQGIDRQRAGRAYLEGTAPTWRIAGTDIPVWLRATESLYRGLKLSLDNRDRVFAVHGQSGSGKTTALMQALLRYVRENSNHVLYELRSDTKSLRSALGLIARMNKDNHVVVYIGDAFIYGDSLYEDVMSIDHGSMTIVTSARSGEWSQHINRRIGDISTVFKYQRFLESDYDPLIERLLEYVPAPRFKRMTQDERRRKLHASKSQLLIALKETTESEKFTDVITREYLSLPDDACQMLALMVGIATIARTGLSEAAAREAYKHFKFPRSFNETLEALDGIVSRGQNDRLWGRHELYVRHIIENVADFALVVDAMKEVLRTYTKYGLPIVKQVGRQDALLFKFILNHNFVAEIARRRSALAVGLGLYEEFEISFQLDGHYWLQYGQYLVEMGRLEQAIGVLNKSIQAYPGNLYAAHAYADVQLRVAGERELYDAVTIELIGDAVKSLEEQHARADWESDQYPIVTLSEKHVGALIKHGQHEQARAMASKYFRQVEDLTRRNSAEPLQRVRERLAHYLTSRQWSDGAGAARNQRRPARRR